jgi:hypothetical protein
MSPGGSFAPRSITSAVMTAGFRQGSGARIQFPLRELRKTIGFDETVRDAAGEVAFGKIENVVEAAGIA